MKIRFDNLSTAEKHALADLLQVTVCALDSIYCHVPDECPEDFTPCSECPYARLCATLTDARDHAENLAERAENPSRARRFFSALYRGFRLLITGKSNGAVDDGLCDYSGQGRDKYGR